MREGGGLPPLSSLPYLEKEMCQSYTQLCAQGWEHLENIRGYQQARDQLGVLRARADSYVYCVGEASPIVGGSTSDKWGMYRRGGKTSYVTILVPPAPSYSPQTPPQSEPERNTFSMAGHSR